MTLFRPSLRGSRLQNPLSPFYLRQLNCLSATYLLLTEDSRKRLPKTRRRNRVCSLSPIEEEYASLGVWARTFPNVQLGNRLVDAGPKLSSLVFCRMGCVRIEAGGTRFF